MSIEQELLEAVTSLPLDRQREILDFARFLRAKGCTKGPRKPLRGLCSDLPMSLSAADVADLRDEMWRGFPRDLPQ